MFRVATAASLLLLATLAQAQVYKVIGPDGKVRFTDKPPIDDTSLIEKIGDAPEVELPEQPAKKVQSLPPIPAPPGADLYSVALERIAIELEERTLEENPDIGENYRFSSRSRSSVKGTCKSPSRALWRPYVAHVGSNTISESTQRVLTDAGYRGQTEKQLFSLQESVAHDLSLAAIVTRISLKTCSSKYWVTDGDLSFAPEKADTELTIKWALFDNLRRRIIFEGETSGAHYGFDGPVEQNGIRNSFKAAYSQALSGLLAQSAFVELLIKSDTRPSALAAQSAIEVTLNIRHDNSSRFSQIARELTPSVCTVRTTSGHGSCFLVDPSGYVITNRHVVGQASSVILIFGDNELTADVVRTGQNLDVALIKASKPLETEALSISARPPSVGEELYIVGTPLHESFRQTVTRGILSSMREEGGLRYFQTDAAVNPGNSGGPAFNLFGEVIGIAVASVRDRTGSSVDINYLIPVMDALEDLGIETPGP